jgi:hypothetical protein
VFNVFNSGSTSYVINNGVPNAPITLIRGKTYSFVVKTAGHPFWIKTAAATGTASGFATGISGNGIENGELTFAVPLDAPSQLFYICQYHAGMSGVINIIDGMSEFVGRVCLTAYLVWYTYCRAYHHHLDHDHRNKWLASECTWAVMLADLWRTVLW